MQLILQLQSLAVWAIVDFCVALVASAHVVLHKRNARAAIGWVGMIWLTPFIGTTLYLLLGINRIQRHAKRKRPSTLFEYVPCVVPIADSEVIVSPSLRDLNLLGERISAMPLTAGNAVEVLINGDQAYPAMLSAIAAAETTITMSTYIFDRDRAGLQFVEALG